jgi:hypothetical protein
VGIVQLGGLESRFSIPISGRSDGVSHPIIPTRKSQSRLVFPACLDHHVTSPYGFVQLLAGARGGLAASAPGRAGRTHEIGRQ